MQKPTEESSKWTNFPEPYELLWLKVIKNGGSQITIISGWWTGTSFDGKELKQSMRVLEWMRNI